jgi:hypothetical protein
MVCIIRRNRLTKFPLRVGYIQSRSHKLKCMTINQRLKLAAFSASITLMICAAFYFLYLASEKSDKNEFQPVSVSMTSDKALRERFQRFSDLIDVGLCQEAYDGFITAGSKVRKGYEGFLAHCQYRQEKWKNFSLENVVFSGDNRADIKLAYDLGRPDLENERYRDCANSRFSKYITCETIAPLKYERTTTLETWILEDGKWKRDY